jgi:hypothetical protein
LLLFVSAVSESHALNRSLDPARHQISEYANGRAGAVMVVGFAAWSLSLKSRRCSLGAI